MTDRERKAHSRAPGRELKLRNIAVLDFETDPFEKDDGEIAPFAGCLYSDNFQPVIIWEPHRRAFIKKVMKAINALPEPYTIYAHNGGKFDFLFLISELRGQVQFKGRGIMSAKIGPHELRDSFHIIPEKLANWQKDTFDYTKLRKGSRERFKQEIIRYMTNDCKYLLEIVLHAVKRYGLKMSIGQMAMCELKKHYSWKRISGHMDAYLRRFFFGGRVECIEGGGHFKEPFKLFDVNSMYPHVMTNYWHPIGDDDDYIIRPGGEIGAKTCFIDLDCKNHGALIRKNEKGETSAEEIDGRFLTTIHEYRMAKKYRLIERVKINCVIDCESQTKFGKFILPLYGERQANLELLKIQKKGSPEYNETKKDTMFMKQILVNSFGKFAQNPRKFQKYFLTDPGKEPDDGEDWGTEPFFQGKDYCVWRRKDAIMRFNNVGTAASITGAARAVLMEALQFASRPIYCDTDSIICQGLGGLKLDQTELGAWKLEQEFSEIIIAGKKLYAVKLKGTGEINVKSKGISKIRDIAEELKARASGYMAAGLLWEDLKDMLAGGSVIVRSPGPTLNRNSVQQYLRREARQTAPVRMQKHPLIERLSA